MILKKNGERGAVFVEAAFAFGILGVIFISFMLYFNKYLGKDEELLAKQLLSLGRLNVIPPLLSRSNGSCMVTAAISGKVSLYLRNSFVTRDVAVSGGACLAQADIRAFFVRFNATHPDGQILGQDIEDPTPAKRKAQIFKCDGTISEFLQATAPADAAHAIAALPLAKATWNRSPDAGSDKTYMVVFSNLFTDFKPIIMPADVSACMDPVSTPSSPP